MNEHCEESNKLQKVKIYRPHKLKSKLIGTAIVCVILLVSLLLVWLYGYNYAKNKTEQQLAEYEQYIEELLNTPVVLEPVTPEIVQSVLNSKTKEITELASAEYMFTNAARFTDTKDIAAIFDWMTEKSFVQKWDGSIKAGIDLSQISVSVRDNIITVTLPAAQILSYEIDYDSVEVLDEKNNIFNPISVTDKNNFDKETAEAMKQRAIENGLLEKAQENAENVIYSLIIASIDNIQDYKIEFKTLED